MKQSTLNWGINQPLLSCFLSIKDPRVRGRVTYPLINIIAITLLGLISDCDTWKAIELFARTRRRWLSQFLDLRNGIPSHQTIARVFSLIEPRELEACLVRWISLCCQLISGDVISIDGKTQRGSSHLQGNQKANHIISAYSAKHEAVMGSVKTPDKSNEIKGIPVLLKSLQLQGLTVTLDAMGTQKGIANLIRQKQGHYVLALKENHKRLYKKVDRLFSKSDERGFQAMVYRQNTSHDYGHGRIEKRRYTILPLMYLHQYKKRWRDLRCFVRVQSTRELANGKVETATRYYLSSLTFKDDQKIVFAIREHWEIENGLHYKLDVGLGEDACQIYRGNAAQNLGVMRKIVLKLLNDETSHKAGIALKRKKAAFNTRYLRKVVGF